jgi:hypothetical protein
MKEIISTVAVVTDAREPSVTHKVLFKDFRSYYNTEIQEESITMKSYKVIDDAEGEYEFIREHSRTVDKATIDAIVAGLTITSTDYTDIRNEQIAKGIQHVIDADGIFGLTSAQLTIR